MEDRARLIRELLWDVCRRNFASVNFLSAKVQPTRSRARWT
ncbi:hypothetical protein RRSWK_04579 [Rhodopirellula sp. SWK7]|nr:hypothetical protein RRSWK_04579 [Rhodopirellula sp. SWK7]